MEKCKLCLSNLADKKGSHVISQFLIQSMVNDEGQQGRDKEVGFAIGEYIETYFGRSVSPDTITQILGRDINKQELVQNSNLYTRDFFLCTQCENKLSYLEDYYSKNGLSFEQKDKLIINKADSLISTLFWISNLWRINVTNFCGLKLKVKEENKLRNILIQSLGNSIKEISSNILSTTKENILNLAYVILVDTINAAPTNNFFFASPHNDKPYSLMINNYVLFFYMKRTHFGCIIQTFLDFEKKLSRAFLNPFISKSEVLVPLTDDLKREGAQRLIELKQKHLIERHQHFIYSVLSNVSQFLPQLNLSLKNQIYQETMNDFLLSPIEGEIRLSQKRLFESLTTICQKYGLVEMNSQLA